MLDRRHTLRLVAGGTGTLARTAALAGSTSLAGCAGPLLTPTYRIHSLGAFNRDRDPHDLTLRIDRRDEMVYEETVRLDAMRDGEVGGAAFTGDWPRDRGPWVLSARVDENDWAAIGPDLREGQADCYSIRYLINEEGLLTPFTESCADLGVETTGSESE
ncbi:hypothetical protein [Salinirubrum litoreum]|uniref:Lipoprotein n=1 Tax=Salinirubrum litoreum TaxID=1126234 RepID=A0ABD5R629_9EURY|nr:hypothetical protein [Salinirubrum litoreum]